MGKQFYYKWIFQKMPVIDAKQNPICTFKLLCVQNHSQATLCTAHAWINQDCKESIVIISDDLNHTKNAVYTFMSFLYNHLTNKYPTIETINTFSDGAASQFKQRYLFSNLHTWEQNTQTNIIWNFFATSHGKGAVDGLGGTVKHSVWRFVKAGGNAPLDAMSYSEIALQCNPNTSIFFISSEGIGKKSDEMTEHWHQILPVPNTLKLHCIKTQGPDKLSVFSSSYR